MSSNNKVDARITSVNRKASDEWNYKEHSNDGIHFLSGILAAPVSHYYGFTPLDSVVINSITFLNSSKISGDITAIDMIPGLYYPIPGGFSTITLSSGTALLYKSMG